jgi:hypothetical protein
MAPKLINIPPDAKDVSIYPGIEKGIPSTQK